ncbi:LysE family translocator [Pseudoxanthomonas wuyuanensis]|uniref:Threonine/homoserine/homoserine lactone efflux protein n=1 Tax=Pseudoxanthomonas wuyuanensis TaxID=1073196 RepID=A0A286D7G3_9GAMM|nr:LysE family translocator [Pseudoxanthomonas wuyuanensis]SOD54575.1 Threonine/homoserine/homoserine lactone efflux protein [Pseudoxanthomonas wuyuanensis]
MMDFTAWLLFCTLSLATAFSPGPAVLLAVSNAATLGARRALVSSAGNAAGVFLVSATAMLGLGALLKTSALWFGVLKAAGATYLIYLGIRQWRSGSISFASPEGALRAPPQACIRLFLQGLLVAATNPKSILFFTALLPQFMRQDAPMLRQFLALTLTFAACTALSHLCYVAMARGLERWFAGRRALWFNRLSGMAFVLLGIGLLRLRRVTA